MAQIRSSAPLPADVPFDVKPMGYEPGFEIGYVVKGEGLASVKKDSLVMDHILTREGVDLAASRAGQPGYEMGAFPKVSEDGRYASFSVKVNQDAFGKVESLALKGSITLLMATQRETASALLTTFPACSSRINRISMARRPRRRGRSASITRRCPG